MASKYNFKELMKERHSCRRYQSKAIPQGTLKEIFPFLCYLLLGAIHNHGQYMLHQELL